MPGLVEDARSGFVVPVGTQAQLGTICCMAKRTKSSGIKERIYGLFFLAGGIFVKSSFIQAFLHGGSFGVITTALAPVLIVSGLVLLVKPGLYGSVTTIEYSGKNMGDTKTLAIISVLAVIGLAVKASLYSYASR